MDLSVKIFDQVILNKFLNDSSIILFLNKKDEFKTKVQEKGNLSTYYPDYIGKNS